VSLTHPLPLFDAAPAWSEAWLATPDGHQLHITQHGRPDGRPALLLHGGPGSGLSPLLRRFFDPAHWRLIGIDQRGAGASRPAASTTHNTTAHLLADLRQLRAHLAIPRWLVVGGSWGATLGVAHAADQPDAVAGLLLRSAFLARPSDIQAFFDRGTAPDAAAGAAWSALDHLLPAGPSGDWPAALAAQFAPPLSDGLPATPAQHAVAAAWWAWEQALAGAATPAAAAPTGAALDALVQRYRVQAHYLHQACWLQDWPLLARAAACPAVPTLLLHGTADRVCPAAGATALHAALAHSQLQWVAGAGHDPSHPAMAAAMGRALARFAAQGDFGPPVPASHGAAPCPCA